MPGLADMPNEVLEVIMRAVAGVDQTSYANFLLSGPQFWSLAHDRRLWSPVVRLTLLCNEHLSPAPSNPPLHFSYNCQMTVDQGIHCLDFLKHLLQGHQHQQLKTLILARESQLPQPAAGPWLDLDDLRNLLAGTKVSSLALDLDMLVAEDFSIDALVRIIQAVDMFDYIMLGLREEDSYKRWDVDSIFILNAVWDANRVNNNRVQLMGDGWLCRDAQIDFELLEDLMEGPNPVILTNIDNIPVNLPERRYIFKTLKVVF